MTRETVLQATSNGSRLLFRSDSYEVAWLDDGTVYAVTPEGQIGGPKLAMRSIDVEKLR